MKQYPAHPNTARAHGVKQSYLNINGRPPDHYSTSEVSRALSINRENAGRCSVRGKKTIEKYSDLKDIAK
jgi:hypothetical protein